MNPLRDKPHTVYRMYAEDGTVLYVGCTSDIGRRTAQHSSGREWFGEIVRIEVEHYADRSSAVARESELITALDPKHQVSFNNRSLNGWERRRRERDAAHDRGEPCREWNCKACVDEFGPLRQRDRFAAPRAEAQS